MDKASAELAISRLTKEIPQLQNEIIAVETSELLEWAERKPPIWTIAGTIVGIVAFFVTMSSGAFWLMLLSLLLLGVSIWVHSKRAYNPKLARTNKQTRLLALQDKLSEKQNALQRNRQIVDS